MSPTKALIQASWVIINWQPSLVQQKTQHSHVHLRQEAYQGAQTSRPPHGHWYPAPVSCHDVGAARPQKRDAWQVAVEPSSLGTGLPGHRRGMPDKWQVAVGLSSSLGSYQSRLSSAYPPPSIFSALALTATHPWSCWHWPGTKQSLLSVWQTVS